MSLALALACGPEPSTQDARFDDLRATSTGPIDGDLDARGDLATVVGRFAPLTAGDASAEVAAFATTWDSVLSGDSLLLTPLPPTPGIGTSTIGHLAAVSGGLPVFGAYVTGEVSPPYGVTLLVAHLPLDATVDPTPAVTATDAGATAADVGIGSATATGEPVLGIFNGGLLLDDDVDHDGTSVLAWQVPLFGATVWVDAHDGEVLWVVPNAQPALDLDLYSAERSEDVEALSGQFTTRVAWMDENGTLVGANPSQKALDAWDDIVAVHNYFETNHQFTGIDGAGLVPTTMYVHFGPPDYPNAFFQADALWFGDDFVGLDVLAHEYTHGIVHHGADLAYAGWSGALNESIADSFGAFADDADKWELGEDAPIGTIRWFENPTRGHQPHHWKTREKLDWNGKCKATQPKCPDGSYCMYGYCMVLSDDNDWGYVHTNSGITNKATWLMAVDSDTVRQFRGAQVRSIGQDLLARVMLSAVKFYLQPLTRFGQFAREMVAACKADAVRQAAGTLPDVHDCGAMLNAYYAVGIHKGPDTDEDTIIDAVDGCPREYDPNQEDSDQDTVGDACDDLVGARIKVTARHTNSMDEYPVHIVFQDETMEPSNRVEPGSSDSRRIVANGWVTAAVGREGAVWTTDGCGPLVEGGEYEAVYWDGLGLVTYTFTCWRTGPGVEPPDPTDLGLE